MIPNGIHGKSFSRESYDKKCYFGNINMITIFKINESNKNHKKGQAINLDLELVTEKNAKCESEEELKSFLMKVKEDSEKASLKLNIQKTKIMASGPITS